MRDFLRRHSLWLEGGLGLVLAGVGAVYANVLTNGSDEPGSDLPSTLEDLGMWNLLPFVAMGILALNLYIGALPSLSLNRVRKQLIEDILASACRSLIRPNFSRHIRAIITICDYRQGCRRTTYTYNVRADPERTASFPFDFGVTGEAYTVKAAVARELPDNHLETYSPEIRPLIYPQLRCVLAVPLFNPLDPAGRLLGILAFDTAESMQTMRFDNREVKDLAQSWGDLISQLLVM